MSAIFICFVEYNNSMKDSMDHDDVPHKIYVLDSTAFLEKYSEGFADKLCATVFDVSEEMKNPYASIRFDMMLQSGLSLIEPSEDAVSRVRDAVMSTKDKLSETDIKVISLALQFKDKGKAAVVVSDDYGVQNVSKTMGIEFLPVSQKGISRTLSWKRKCTACGNVTPKEICEVCGTETKFVSKSKKR